MSTWENFTEHLPTEKGRFRRPCDDALQIVH